MINVTFWATQPPSCKPMLVSTPPSLRNVFGTITLEVGDFVNWRGTSQWEYSFRNYVALVIILQWRLIMSGNC